MQTTMNSMVTMFTAAQGNDTGTKRSAPRVQSTSMTSPKRHQNLTGSTFSTQITEGETQQSLYDFMDGEACTPLPSSQHTFTEDSADEAMTPRDAHGEGQGQ